MYRNCFKRVKDFTLSLLAIILLSPVFVIVAVLVKANFGSPVLFKQKRVGLNEKVFTIYKFRTMTDERDENGDLLPNEVRLTRFGRILRSTSLDELPQLFNILNGDMSIIGPRPLLVSYLPYYTEEEKRRHHVRPGLTGLSQVNGRHLLCWNKRFEMDVTYTSNISFIQDIKIIFLTVKKVIQRKDLVGVEQHVVQRLDVERGLSRDGDI